MIKDKNCGWEIEQKSVFISDSWGKVLRWLSHQFCLLNICHTKTIHIVIPKNIVTITFIAQRKQNISQTWDCNKRWMNEWMKKITLMSGAFLLLLTNTIVIILIFISVGEQQPYRPCIYQLNYVHALKACLCYSMADSEMFYLFSLGLLS